MLKVTKFGGSSLCDSAGFARVREIVLADPARRVVVVWAGGGGGGGGGHAAGGRP